MLPTLRGQDTHHVGSGRPGHPVDMACCRCVPFPDVEVHIFPNCGHWVMIEQKDAWERVVLAFLTHDR